MRDQLNTTIQGILQVPIQVHAPSAAQFNASSLTYANTGDVIGFSIWQAIMSSQFYMNYKRMYDSVKLNGFRCKITGNSAASLTLASGLSSVTTAVAWDRNGISGGALRVGVIPPLDTGTLPKTPSPFVRPATTVDSGPARINRLLSYGSVKQKPWSPGNAFTQYISGYAQTAQETQQWVPTEKLDVTYASKVAGEAVKWHVGFPSGLSSAGYRLDVSAADTNVPYTAGSVPFDPVVMVGVFDVPVANPASDPVFTFSVEYKADVSFRGTRSGMAINMGTVPEEQMDQALQTLTATVPAGETMNLVPDEGVLWNQASLTGGPPTVYDRVGVDQVVPNPAAIGGYNVTLLPHTTEVYGNDVDPEAFVVDANPGTEWTPPPVVGPAYARTTVFYEPVKQEPVYVSLERTFTENGHYTGNGVFSGYDITVDVPPVQVKPTITKVRIQFSNGTTRTINLRNFSPAVTEATPYSLEQYQLGIIINTSVSPSFSRIFAAYENTTPSGFGFSPGDRPCISDYSENNPQGDSPSPPRYLELVDSSDKTWVIYTFKEQGTGVQYSDSYSKDMLLFDFE